MVEDYPRNVIELEQRFCTENACRTYLMQLRWPDGFICPRCGEQTGSWNSTRGRMICTGCRYHASVTAGTIFERTQKPLSLWFRAVWHVTCQKNGASAVSLQQTLGLGSYLTAWTWLHKLRRGRIYILERGGHALRAVLHNGQIKTLAGTGEKGFRDGAALEAQLAAPKHICIDDCDNVYIADEANQAIRKYNPVSQKIETVLGRTHGDSRIRLSKPHGVCWHDGCLYVVDTGHNRILRLR